MNPGDALDHDGFPYCKADYAKQFGPKGIIQGVVADSGLGPMPDQRAASMDFRGSRPDFVDPLKEKADSKRTGAADSVVKGSSATEAQIAAERNRQAIRAAERAFDDDDAEDDGGVSSRMESMRFQDPAAITAGLSGSKGKSYAGKNLAVGGGDSCRQCGKAVGFADKITAIGGKWHKACFTCQYCNKSFPTAGDAIEANGKPCCNPCFKKNHPSSRKN
jgi:hypothetical protein